MIGSPWTYLQIDIFLISFQYIEAGCQGNTNFQMVARQPFGKKQKLRMSICFQHPSIVLNPLHDKFYSKMPCTPFCRPLFGKSHLTINQVLIKM